MLSLVFLLKFGVYHCTTIENNRLLSVQIFIASSHVSLACSAVDSALGPGAKGRVCEPDHPTHEHPYSQAVSMKLYPLYKHKIAINHETLWKYGIK